MAAPNPEIRLYESGGMSGLDSWGKETSPASFIGENSGRNLAHGGELKRPKIHPAEAKQNP